MTKLLLAKTLGGIYLSSSLFMGGAGGYLVLNEIEIVKTIEKRKIDDGGRIIKNSRSDGTWTDIKEYSKSQFTHICTGTGPNAQPECNRYLRANNLSKDKEQIFLYIGNPTQVTSQGPIYKFIYKTEIDGNKEFQGQCDDSTTGGVEAFNNPCANSNLPEGWKKEFLISFLDLIKKLNS